VPAAKSGVVTGTLLAIARIAGETAPILLTILGSNYFFRSWNSSMDALPLRIFRDARWDDPQVQAEAWGVALILILIVLSINIGVRLAARGRFRR
jgi:phosphate transport system permease protein